MLLCVIQHCHCSSCAQHSAPTAAAGRVLCASGNPRCTLSTTVVFVVVVSCIGLCTRTFRNLCGSFSSVPIIRDMFVDSSTTRTNRSYKTYWQYVVTECSVPYTADRQILQPVQRGSVHVRSLVAARVYPAVVQVSDHMAFYSSYTQPYLYNKLLYCPRRSCIVF